MSPRLFVRPAMIDLKLEEQWEWGTGRGEKTHPRPSLSLFFTDIHPPWYKFLSPRPSAAVKIKNGSYIYLQEGTEHSLTKTTLALWATGGRECFDFLDEEC